ncbi:MAG TPA: IclR family transcriptional regulator [Erysipelothrix sp.]
MKKSPVINSVVDSFKILDLISEHHEMGIADIAKQLELPKTTVFRIIKSLEEAKVIKQLNNANYALDYHMLHYANSVITNEDITQIAESFMQEAVDLTGETINLGMEYNQDLVILKRIHGDFYQLQTALRPVGQLYCSGMGKLFLSQWSDEKLKTYFQDLPKRTINTVNTFELFKANQKEIINDHISIDNEEYEYGMSCYAVPIFDKNGKVVYALSVSGPTGRLEYKGIDFLTSTLKQCAQNIQDVIIAQDI